MKELNAIRSLELKRPIRPSWAGRPRSCGDSRRTKCSLVLGLAVLALSKGAAATPVSWPRTFPLDCVAWGNGTFVAAGSGGAVLTSSDGLAWFQQVSPTTDNILSLGYANGLFLAGTLSGEILTSPNGINWSFPSVLNCDRLFGMAYGKSTYVMVGDSAILTSVNGTEWTRQTNPLPDTNSLWSVAFGNDLFVAVSARGSILTSDDAVSWTVQNTGTTNFLTKVIVAPNRFVAVGLRQAVVLSSPDGTNWVQHDPGTTTGLLSITWGEGLYVAVGYNGTIVTSPDLVDWTPRSGGTADSLGDVVYANGLFVATSFGPGMGGNTGTILISADGLTWTNLASPPWPPSISTQPSDQTVLAGMESRFTVVASGTPPLSYQWRKDGVEIDEATNAILVLPGVRTNQAGFYSVVVSNPLGSVTSSEAVLTVTVPLPSSAVAWGYGPVQTTVPAGLTDLIAISAGSEHCLALKQNNTVIAWGDNRVGQTNVPAGVTRAVAIVAGGYFNLVLQDDGTVLAWGDNNDTSGNFTGQATVPEGLSNVVALAAGWKFGLALKADGTVLAWGWNQAGETQPPPGLSNVIAIAAGTSHGLALRRDGTLVGWGRNDSGQATVPEGLSNVTAIAGGGNHSLALLSDGRVAAWGSNSHNQTDVPEGLTNVVAISAGAFHSLALQADGTVVAWGEWFNGSTFVPATVPAGLSHVVAIDCGFYFNLALLGRPDAVRCRLCLPTRLGNTFCVSLPTWEGKFYILEFKNSLSDPDWSALSTVRGYGCGVPRTLIDPTATPPQRFYRVREQ